MPVLVIEYHHPDGKPYRWESIRVTNKVGEVTTIWGGSPGVWDEVKFASHVPSEARPEDEVRAYVMNNSSSLPIYIDNFSVNLLRKAP